MAIKSNYQPEPAEASKPKEAEAPPPGHLDSINEPGSHTLGQPETVDPVITSLDPASCAIKDPDFTLYVHGTGFNAESVIHFAGHDEPTTLNEDMSLSTGVKPSLWGSPTVVQCSVFNGEVESNKVDFEFAAEGADVLRAKGAKPFEKTSGEPADFELIALDPDYIAISERRLFLTVTGVGFDRSCVVVFDDEEIPTAYVNKTTLTCSPPMASEADTVDVEVHRGEDMSDVLSFEFVSSTAQPHRPPERKPKKAEPVHKRTKKSKR